MDTFIHVTNLKEAEFHVPLYIGDVVPHEDFSNQELEQSPIAHVPRYRHCSDVFPVTD